MWCSWRTVSAPSGASRYQPLIGAEQATSLAGGLDFARADNDFPTKRDTSPAERDGLPELLRPEKCGPSDLKYVLTTQRDVVE